MNASFVAYEHSLDKIPFFISHSSGPRLGHYGSHITGENPSTWEGMK